MVTQGTKEERVTGKPMRARAKRLRHAPASTETLFWSAIRNRALSGYKFRRQIPIGPYIADFLCAEHRLIVELDGPFHRLRPARDTERDLYLEAQGYRVLRFTNDDVRNDMAIVLHAVKHALDTGTPSPCPLPRRGRGKNRSQP